MEQEFKKDVINEENKQAEDALSELSKKAYSYLKENKTHDAEQMFNEILSMSASNNYALVGLGDLERKRRNFNKALEYYSTCLESHPENNYALFGLADSYRALKKLNLAIPVWEQYLQMDEKNVSVLTRVADAYRKTHNLEKSKEVYLRVLDIEEENAYALIGLGNLFYDFKDFKTALYYWSRMLDITEGTGDIRVLTSIGNCHKKLKAYDQGIHYFKEALKAEKNNFYALFGLADCYRGKNDHQQSVECWNRILEFDPNNKVILTRAGDAYRNIGDIDNALHCYNRAIDIEYDVYAIFGLALITKQQGKYEDAIISFNRLMQSNFNNYRLYIELAECYLSLNQKGYAIDILKAASDSGARNSDISEMLKRLQQN